ncbi:MAG TPA: cupredoxin domain-containing protein [Methylomirabilota bacterium]|nr:cupredoxin domain-containing protein [Methylomirabilota bacterium]
MKRFKTACVSLCVLVATLSPTGAAAEGVRVPLSSDGVQRLEVTVDSYSFSPDRIVVKRDIPVEFILRSVARFIPHNFVLTAPDAGFQIKSELRAGETVSILFTPRRVGTLKFLCDKKLLFFKSHEEQGMVGALEVTE